jgi:HD superfamily phosphohydrolase
MVKLALQRAKRLAVQGRLEWPRREDTVYKALLGQRLTIAEFTDLDDVSVLHCFKIWMGSMDTILAGLCRGLMYRRVYKTIDLSRVDPARVPLLVEASEQAVRDAGGEPGYELFYDEPRNTPYEVFADQSPGEASEILVREADGTLTPFAALSPLTEALNRQLMFRRLHVAARWRETVERAMTSAV